MRARSSAAALFAVAALFAPGCKRDNAAPAPLVATPPPRPGALLTGQAAMGDWTTDAPGVRRKIAPEDLPAPFATESAKNPPRRVARPAGAAPAVPPGFEVTLFASDLKAPRMARVAPNGDLFVAESESHRIRVLRDADGDGKPEIVAIFAEGLRQPFGIAFHPPADPAWVYVANTDAIVRFPYVAGDTKARGRAAEIYGSVSGGGRLTGGGHWTRDIVFSRDGSKLYLSVGSRSNASDDENEARRARIFELSPDGTNERVYASGIRNPVGLAIHPDTGELWTSVNERDELGDDLVPDYVTHVTDRGFYGWPWFYIGKNQDPRHARKRPELRDKVIVPDVLVQAHSASLGMTFYTGAQFPEAYRGSAFAAEHGSWNRSRRTGYKVIQVPLKDGRATGEYVDFMTGFVTAEGDVWGRPVAVAVAADGALFVTDDAGDCVWRVAHTGSHAPDAGSP
ncbi:MAG: sorbosone dehydrogenase family protein [Labilithrix sp.]|nr:sorbosone dehydrogenase family protein [Labilithrix sp.]